MIDLYTFPSSNGQRASIVLEACRVPYRVHTVDLRKGEQKSPEFLRINPAGTIPVIVDPDGPGGRPLTLSQSGAIMIYLAEKSGQMLPTPGAARIETLRWLMATMTDLAPASAAIFLTSLAAEPPPGEIVAFWEQRFLSLLQTFDAQLGTREYLAGELTIADLALYPTAVGRKSLIDASQGLAHLKRWMAVMAAMPEVQRGMAVPG